MTPNAKVGPFSGAVMLPVMTGVPLGSMPAPSTRDFVKQLRGTEVISCLLPPIAPCYPKPRAISGVVHCRHPACLMCCPQQHRRLHPVNERVVCGKLPTMATCCIFRCARMLSGFQTYSMSVIVKKFCHQNIYFLSLPTLLSVCLTYQWPHCVSNPSIRTCVRRYPIRKRQFRLSKYNTNHSVGVDQRYGQCT